MKAVVHEGHALGGRQAPGVWKRRCAQENLTATGRADAPIRTRKPATGATKTINLALQGGGTHEAFTWGALDRLLEERVEIEGISATSAGAMNATGFATGGRDGARAALAAFLEAPQPYSNDFAGLPRVRSRDPVVLAL
jgi:predicted acylesterase/phospholipase RssA